LPFEQRLRGLDLRQTRIPSLTDAVMRVYRELMRHFFEGMIVRLRDAGGVAQQASSSTAAWVVSLSGFQIDNVSQQSVSAN
jgi:hypothetical protein